MRGINGWQYRKLIRLAAAAGMAAGGNIGAGIGYQPAAAQPESGNRRRKLALRHRSIVALAAMAQKRHENGISWRNIVISLAWQWRKAKRKPKWRKSSLNGENMAAAA
jgi:hypothetical protein